MAATVEIMRWTGAVGAVVKTPITGINTRANAEDQHTTGGTVNPVQIPPSGTNYSFWVNTRLSVYGSPAVSPSGTINNIRWFTDAGGNNFGTAITCQGNEATTYVRAIGTDGQTGVQLTVANYAGGGLTTPVEVFTFQAATPKSIGGPNISNPATGDFGNFFVYQISVGPTAGPGATSQETFTWKYDET